MAFKIRKVRFIRSRRLLITNCMLTLAAGLALFCSNTSFANQANRKARADRQEVKEAARLFTQDRYQICRRLPETFRLDDELFASELLNQSLTALLEMTQGLLRTRSVKPLSTEAQPLSYQLLDRALLDLDSQLSAQEKLKEGLSELNRQFVDVIERDAFAVGQSFKFADLFPKALLVYVGGRASLMVKKGVAVSATLGFAITNDRVDCVSKEAVAQLSLLELKKAFEEIDLLRDQERFSNSVTRLNPWHSSEVKLRLFDGREVEVTSTNELDFAPIMMVSPAIGVGVGGGLGFRAGLAGIWWSGNRILEPEHLYGWGLAGSQDWNAGLSGFNFKFGLMNSSAVSGSLNYMLGGVAWDFGPALEASPLKANIIWLDDPERLMTTMGLGADGWIDGMLKSVGERLFEGISVEP